MFVLARVDIYSSSVNIKLLQMFFKQYNLVVHKCSVKFDISQLFHEQSPRMDSGEGLFPPDPRHVLVDEYLGPLQLLAVPHDGRLHVVGGEGGDDVARCRLAFPFRPTLCDRTMSWASIVTPSFVAASSRTTTSVSSPAFSGIPRILITLRREYCSSSSHLFSSSVTWVFSSLISEFFLASRRSNLPVMVFARPRSSC